LWANAKQRPDIIISWVILGIDPGRSTPGKSGILPLGPAPLGILADKLAEPALLEIAALTEPALLRGAASAEPTLLRELNLAWPAWAKITMVSDPRLRESLNST